MASRNLSIASEEPLGSGQDGTVWLTSRETAIKAMNREQNYLNERDSYRLLAERSIDRIGIFGRLKGNGRQVTHHIVTVSIFTYHVGSPDSYHIVSPVRASASHASA